jgi:hypothetical protein
MNKKQRHLVPTIDCAMILLVPYLGMGGR